MGDSPLPATRDEISWSDMSDRMKKCSYWPYWLWMVFFFFLGLFLDYLRTIFGFQKRSHGGANFDIFRFGWPCGHASWKMSAAASESWPFRAWSMRSPRALSSSSWKRKVEGSQSLGTNPKCINYGSMEMEIGNGLWKYILYDILRIYWWYRYKILLRISKSTQFIIGSPAVTSFSCKQTSLTCSSTTCSLTASQFHRS